MSRTVLLPWENRQVLRRSSSAVLRMVPRLFTRRLTGERFRSLLQAEEGLEVAGLDAYDLTRPPEHIDHVRLRVPVEHLAEALANGEVLARRFDRVAEEHFVILADVSASVRYPLRRVYEGLPLERGGWSPRPAELLAAKPTLLKLLVGGFASLAAEGGFRLRLVTFGNGTIDEGELVPRPRDAAPLLLERLDRGLAAAGSASPGGEELYEEVAARYQSHKGVFLFVGDFLDPVFYWEEGRRRWRRLLERFRQWGLRRRLVVARVCHRHEVQPPSAVPFGESLQNVWGDRCDVRVESVTAPADHPFWGLSEGTRTARDRLRRQGEWAHVLCGTLKQCCRSYLEVADWPSGPRLRRDIRHSWSRLIGR